MAEEIEADRLHDDPAQGFVGALKGLADRAEREAPAGAVTAGSLVDQLDERAFGLLIFILTLPCLVPALPGAQIIAIPIFLLGAQLLVGRREPWLPRWFLRAKVKTAHVRAAANFAKKRLGWAERIARPRLRVMASGPAERFLGLVVALAALTIMLPITNTIPSLGITLIALGLMTRDGALTILGALVSIAWVAVLAALVFALVTGAGFALDLVREHAPWAAQAIGR